MDDAMLTIGQIARRAGLNVSAVRYYEAQGLLPEAPRIGGQRRYAEDTLARLGVIDVAKRAGFNLDDIRVLLEASDAGEPAHARLQELAQRKLPEVAELIERAQAVQTWLEYATGCDCDRLDVCALFAVDSPLPCGPGSGGVEEAIDRIDRGGRAGNGKARLGAPLTPVGPAGRSARRPRPPSGDRRAARASAGRNRDRDSGSSG